MGALTLGILATGCVGASPGGLSPVMREYAGEYTRGVQGSWFQPCSVPAGERLWVTFIGSAATEARNRTDSGLLLEAPTFVRWRAERVTDGRVGPGGPALFVHEILETRRAAEGDCAADGSGAEVGVPGLQVAPGGMQNLNPGSIGKPDTETPGPRQGPGVAVTKGMGWRGGSCAPPRHRQSGSMSKTA
ncbi:MAG TPA: hypothetical protein VLA43_15180 [Longimicrobiales bacterium]|nr:hypothetical protein [Longimicrobiales bacterium]